MAYDAGDIISRLLLDMTDFKRALKSAPGVAKKDLAKVEKAMTKTTRAMSKTEEAFVTGSEKRGERFQKSWWKRFGTVAVGFTIAYRSMQVVQRGVEELVGSFTKGLVAIDDFRTAVIRTAAALSMLSEQPTTEGLQAYLAFATKTFEELELVAARHFATADDLREAYAKFTTMRIVPVGPEQLEAMASLVDWILIAEEAMGRTLQIRSEIESAVEGQLRRGAVMARMANQVIPDYREQLKLMDATSSSVEKSKIFFEMMAPILDAITGYSGEILKTHMAWKANIDAIFKKIWRAGLNQAYEDLLGLMRSISETLIDHGQLTETAIKFAFGYHVAWEAVKLILEGVYNSGKGIYATWVSLTGELNIITSLFKVLAADVVIIKHGFQVSAMLLDYIVTKVKEWVNFQLDPGRQKNQKELNELMKEEKWIQERIFAVALKRVKLQADLSKGVEGTEQKLEALREIALKYNKIWKDIRFQIGMSEGLLKPSLFTFDDLNEKIKELNKELLKTLTQIAELGTGIDLERFKKELETKIASLKDFMNQVLDLGTKSAVADETLRKKFLKSWHKALDDKFEYTKFLAQAEYEEFAKFEDLKLVAAVLLNAKLAQIEDQRLADDMKLYTSIAQQNLQTQREFQKDLLAVLEQAPEAYAAMMGEQHATDLWYTNEKIRLNKLLMDSSMKMVEVQYTVADSILGSWTYVYEQLGKKSARAFETYKMMQLGQIAMDTARNIILGVKWAFEHTGKAAPYVAAGMAISMAAQGAMQAAMIQAQQYSGYAAGGWLDTHPKGGKINEGAGRKDDVFLGATPGVAHWGMRDESVFILNKEATKKNGALLEAMNEEAYAKGGWINRGYGYTLSDFVPSPLEVAETLTSPSEWTTEDALIFAGGMDAISNAVITIGSDAYEDYIDFVTELAEVEFDPDAFAGILHSIDQMLGKTTALGDMIWSTQQQFKGWIKQLEEMNASEAQLDEVRNQELAVIEHLTQKMKDDFIEPLEDIIAEGVLTEYGYEMLQLGEWYEEQKKEAEELGLELDTLNAAYAIQRQEIEATRKAIEEDITRRLGILREAKTPGAGLTSAELAIFDLTSEFVDVIEEIQGWTAETGQNFDTLIADATELYELEMEAALAQSEAAQEIQDSLDEWASVIESIDDTIYGLSISMASPASVQERMGIVKGMIDAFPDVSTPEQAAELQGLWDDYLALAQDAYQRPSSEYQAIYNDMINALEGIQADAAEFIQIGEGDLAVITSLEGLGVDLQAIVTAIQADQAVAVTIPDIIIPTITIPDVAVDVTIPDITIPDVSVTIDETLLSDQILILEQIRANTYSIAIMHAHLFNLIEGSLRGGTLLPPVHAEYGGLFSGPKGGYPATLHGTELITPFDEIDNLGKTELYLTINISESKSPQETAAVVEEKIEDFLLRGRGRKLMKNAAKGH